MVQLTHEDASDQRALIDALRSIHPEKVTAAAFRHRKIADVWKGKVRRLLTGHPNVVVYEEGDKTLYQFLATIPDHRLPLTGDARE